MDHDLEQPETFPATVEPQRRFKPNFLYLRSIPGILKIIQMVMALITFILSVSSPWGSGGGGWVNFVSILGLIEAIVWCIFHTLNVIPQILINYFIELIIYSVWTVLFLIAGIVAATQASSYPAVGAAAFFAFLCMVLFGIDSVIQFLDVRGRYKARNDRRPTSTSSNNATTEDTLFVRPTSSDKGFY